jgi:hypothetical protein
VCANRETVNRTFKGILYAYSSANIWYLFANSCYWYPQSFSNVLGHFLQNVCNTNHFPKCKSLLPLFNVELLTFCFRVQQCMDLKTTLNAVGKGRGYLDVLKPIVSKLLLKIIVILVIFAFFISLYVCISYYSALQHDHCSTIKTLKIYFLFQSR